MRKSIAILDFQDQILPDLLEVLSWPNDAAVLPCAAKA